VRIAAQVFGPKQVTHVSTPLAGLVNNLTSCGTNGQLSNYNRIDVYGNSSNAIYGNLYQIATRLSALEEACRNSGVVI
jgi:hypothetical protein